jgi:hypothetical protein
MKYLIEARDRDGRLRVFTYEAESDTAARAQFAAARAGPGGRKARPKILSVTPVEDTEKPQ